MILMIDNYDSFTYNLVQYLRQMGSRVVVIRNDMFEPADILADPPAGIVISPGPGIPEKAGRCIELIRIASGKVPLLGVCLGHQAIARSFGARIVPARRIMHGKTSTVTCDSAGIFSGIKKPFTAMRYHSLAVSKEGLPDVLEISATSDDGEIMGVRHKLHPTEGIQFHPESIMTPQGKRILRNFIKMAEAQASRAPART